MEMQHITEEAVVGGLIAALIVIGVLLIVWALSSAETWVEYKRLGHREEDRGPDEE
jgi:hypothetical protein